MYLEKIKSKGNYYLYLKAYEVRENYSRPYKTVYKFGRADQALKHFYEWRRNFETLFPIELLEMGCSREDLEGWIKTIETGKHHRTGRSFKIEQLASFVAAIFIYI